MRTTRLLAAPALATLFLLAGCGSDPGPGAGTEVGTSPSATVSDRVPTAPPELTSTDATREDDGSIGAVLVSRPLGVEAGEFPGPPMLLFAEVSGTAELESIYTGVPGIGEVVAAVAANPPTAEERLFVYLVAACRVDQISLELDGKKVPMVVSGNSTLKCQPPPMQMVVWKVGSGEVPPDAVPARAVQKK